MAVPSTDSKRLVSQPQESLSELPNRTDEKVAAQASSIRQPPAASSLRERMGGAELIGDKASRFAASEFADRRGESRKRERDEADDRDSKRVRRDDRGAYSIPVRAVYGYQSSHRINALPVDRDDVRKRKGDEADGRDPKRVRRDDRRVDSASAADGAGRSDSPKTTRHALTIQSRPEAPYLRYIREGIKTAECRINGPMFHRYRVGDEINLHNRSEGIICRIEFLHPYKSFAEMIEAEGALNLLPQLKGRRLEGDALMQAAIAVYRGFPGSERVHQQGCLAIGVKYLRGA